MNRNLAEGVGSCRPGYLSTVLPVSAVGGVPRFM